MSSQGLQQNISLTSAGNTYCNILNQITLKKLLYFHESHEARKYSSDEEVVASKARKETLARRCKTTFLYVKDHRTEYKNIMLQNAQRSSYCCSFMLNNIPELKNNNRNTLLRWQVKIRHELGRCTVTHFRIFPKFLPNLGHVQFPPTSQLCPSYISYQPRRVKG